MLRSDTRNVSLPVSWIELMWYASHGTSGDAFVCDCDSGTLGVPPGLSASQVYSSWPVARLYS